MQKAIDKGATLIHVDPRFTRTSAKAHIYAPIRSGTDIAFTGGMTKYIIENKKYFADYVINYTNGACLVNESFGFKDGLFSGWDAKAKKYDRSTWAIQKDKNGIPIQDKTLKNPRCVLDVLYEHYKRYDLDKVSAITGMPKEKLLEAYEAYASTGVKDRAGTVMYALGQTQSTIGVQKIRCLCIMQLLLGNIGIYGGGA